MMQELLQMSPRDPLHRLRYATLLQLQGRSGDALREFQLVLQLYPDAPLWKMQRSGRSPGRDSDSANLDDGGRAERLSATVCSRRWKPL
jgi:hypothetical protein